MDEQTLNDEAASGFGDQDTSGDFDFETPNGSFSQLVVEKHSPDDGDADYDEGEYEDTADEGLDAAGTEGEIETRGPVPYDRFKEVNTKYRTLEQQFGEWAPLIEELKAQGFSNATAVQEVIRQQNQEAHEAAIRQKWNTAYENGEIYDEETARMQAQLEIDRSLLQQQAQRLAQVERNAQISEAMAAYPAAQQARGLFDTLVKSNVPPMEAARQIAEQLGTVTKSVRSQQAAQRPRIAPTGTADRRYPAGSPSQQQRGTLAGARQSFRELLGGNKNKPA